MPVMLRPNARVERSRPGPKRRLIPFILVVLLIFMLASYVLPLPPIRPATAALPALPASRAQLIWPGYGQTAVGAPGYGVLDSHGDNKPVPTASVAKVLTALAVVKQRPLLSGQQGPLITVSEEDVANYKRFSEADGSVVPVEAGEQLSEYQALQALLLPSANNIADLLANWAFGSQAKYVAFANAFVKSLGLKHTAVADASGFSPQTVSTAQDLVLLAENVMDNPVLAEIVGQAQATIPVAGTIQNVNILLGHDEIVGIKTGNTDEAGGCFMVAARHSLDKDHQIVVVAVTMGAPDLSTAINSTLPLLKSAYANFAVATVVKQGQTVGSYTAAWSGALPVTAAHDVTGIIWKPSPPAAQVKLSPITFRSGKAAIPQGEVTAVFGRQTASSPVRGGPLKPPSWRWRLLHPLARW